MKNNKILMLSTIALLAFSVFYYGCKKEEETTTDDNNNNTNTNTADYTAAIDNATAEFVFNDIFRKVTEATLTAKDSVASKSLCPTLTITPFDTTTWPKYLTLDFGTSCVNNGITRSGKIKATLSNGWYRDSGTIITITLENYIVNGYKVEGTKTITNHGRNADSNLYYTVVVTNGKIIKTNYDTIQYNANMTHVWIEGESTTLLSDGLAGLTDDVYEITGTQSGVSGGGTSYMVTIDDDSPLNVNIGCKYIRSGKLDITVLPFDVTVDYGNTPNCDSLATVSTTILGVEYSQEIVLQ